MTNYNLSDEIDKFFDSANDAYELAIPARFLLDGEDKKLKLTLSRRFWVQRQVAEYAKQIGIPEKDMPAIVCTRREVLEMPKELTQGRRTVTHKCFGICFRRAKIIFINVKNHSSLQDVINTIVHELVHYRFRYLRHGKQFDQRIELILKGKKYPVKDLYPTTRQLVSNHDLQHIEWFRPTQIGEIVQYETAEMYGISIEEIDKLLGAKYSAF